MKSNLAEKEPQQTIEITNVAELKDKTQIPLGELKNSWNKLKKAAAGKLPSETKEQHPLYEKVFNRRITKQLTDAQLILYFLIKRLLANSI